MFLIISLLDADVALALPSIGAKCKHTPHPTMKEESLRVKMHVISLAEEEL
jgi:hypothetical protein